MPIDEEEIRAAFDAVDLDESGIIDGGEVIHDMLPGLPAPRSANETALDFSSHTLSIARLESCILHDSVSLATYNILKIFCIARQQYLNQKVAHVLAFHYHVAHRQSKPYATYYHSEPRKLLLDFAKPAGRSLSSSSAVGFCSQN